MINDDLLRILRCPVTREPLLLAEAGLVSRVNSAISQGLVVNRIGEKVTRSLEGGLVNESGSLLFAIHDEIPCLLVDEAIELAPFSPAAVATSQPPASSHGESS